MRNLSKCDNYLSLGSINHAHTPAAADCDKTVFVLVIIFFVFFLLWPFLCSSVFFMGVNNDGWFVISSQKGLVDNVENWFGREQKTL